MTTTSPVLSTNKTTTRLHISPLSPEIYPRVVPTSVQATVSAVSYHQIPTFPERNYGFIELPLPEADKLAARLNGALIKGVKLRVETARPQPTQLPESLPDNRQPKRRKREDGEAQRSSTAVSSYRQGEADRVTRGFELPAARKVRRGWTQPTIMRRDRKTTTTASGKTDDKSKTKARPKKSEFTDKEECLFKNKVKPEPTDSGKKRKRGDDTAVVHEFQNTTKFPTFLRSQGGDASKSTAGYDSEKGWLDAEGQVVEQPRRSKRLSRDLTILAKPLDEQKSKAKAKSMTKATQKLSIRSSAPQSASTQGDTEPDVTSSEDEGSSGEKEESIPEAAVKSKRLSGISTQSAVTADDTSSSGSDTSDEEGGTEKTEQETPTTPARDTTTILSPGAKQLKEEGKDEVHPLEAIFKKPKGAGRKPPGLELKIPFSFFGSGGDNDDEASEGGDRPSDLPAMPQTPFTQADLRFRRERSAAPTPDTAAPTKLLFGPVMDRVPPAASAEPAGGSQPDDSVEEEEEEKGSDDGEKEEKPKRSEFAEKWFWENRGDNNRAWKKRRREAAKEKRQATNRRSSRRNA